MEGLCSGQIPVPGMVQAVPRAGSAHGATQGFAASTVMLLSWEAPAKKQHVGTSSNPTSAIPCPSLLEWLEVTWFVIEIKDKFICET